MLYPGNRIIHKVDAQCDKTAIAWINLTTLAVVNMLQYNHTA